MSKTKQAFASGKAFIPFLTAGDPDLETTEQLILAMADRYSVFGSDRRMAGHPKGGHPRFGRRYHYGRDL